MARNEAKNRILTVLPYSVCLLSSLLPTQSNAPLTTEPLFDGTGINKAMAYPTAEKRMRYSKNHRCIVLLGTNDANVVNGPRPTARGAWLPFMVAVVTAQANTTPAKAGRRTQ